MRCGLPDSVNIKPFRCAFTLLELLIVVLILAILAAIAVPNFLEIATRSKISRAKSDMRTLASALEAYYLDNNAYPPSNGAQTYFNLKRLSTPIAYISNAYIRDPFPHHHSFFLVNRIGYGYQGRQLNGKTATNNSHGVKWWMLISNGPNQQFETIGARLTTFHTAEEEEERLEAQDEILGRIYDPTNGTVSNGDLHRAGGELDSTGVHFSIYFD